MAWRVIAKCRAQEDLAWAMRSVTRSDGRFNADPDRLPEKVIRRACYSSGGRKAVGTMALPVPTPVVSPF